MAKPKPNRDPDKTYGFLFRMNGSLYNDVIIASKKANISINLLINKILRKQVSELLKDDDSD